MIFTVAKIIFTVAEIIFTVAEIIFTVAEVIFTVAETIFTFEKMIFTTVKMVPLGLQNDYFLIKMNNFGIHDLQSVRSVPLLIESLFTTTKEL